MKTLGNPADCEEIVERLRAIGPESQRRWGRMTVVEAVCHLSDAFRLAMGDKAAAPRNSWFTRSVVKHVALRMPMQWPQGVKTVPECESGVGGTPPAAFERDMAELRRQFTRFTERPRQYALVRHPIFGAMSEADWMRWGYLHMDHHLRQFGA